MRNRQFASHPMEIELHAYLDGELEADSRRALEEHLAVCPECARRLSAARAFFARIESMPDLRLERDLSGPVIRKLRGRPRSVPVLGLLALQSAAAVVLLWVAGERVVHFVAQLPPSAFRQLLGPLRMAVLESMATIRLPTTGLQFGLEAWLQGIHQTLPDLGVQAHWAVWLGIGLVAWLGVNSLALVDERRSGSNGG